LIIFAAIPISILATFALMYFCGFTLNIMTFGGLALGVGMLVDSAIVVLENIFQHLERGRERMQSAVEGTEEVATAIFASALTTVVVFLPVLFVRGMAGVTFKQLAVVVVFALFCSLVVALTLIPVLSSRLLRMSRNQSGKKNDRGLLFFLEREYVIFLRAALRHRMLVIVLVLALLGISISLIGHVGVEFMPKADESEVRVSGEMAVGTRIEVVDETFQNIEQIVREAVPEAKIIYTRVGASGWSG
ncbi:MAG: efflux RND transporter permease subunit, partial [Candidatus Hinthialibacter sp.]